MTYTTTLEHTTMAKKTNTKQIEQDKTEEVVTHPQVEGVTTTEVTEVKAIPYKLNDLMEQHKTKSAVIRFLDSEKYSRSQIAKFLDIKYQFVRNVLITPVGKTK